MSLHNTFSNYGSLAKSFHWATVLFIFTAFPVGYFANDLAHQIGSADFDGDAAVIARATLLFSLHKTLGVAAFFTAIARILWMLTQPKPGLLHPDNKPEALVAEAVHWLLYAMMVLVPLSGWIMHAAEVGYAPIWWPFGQGLPFVPKSETVAEVAAGVHWLFVWTLFGTVGLHVAGALKHHVIDRDATLRRMLPRSGTVPMPPEQSHDAKPLGLAAAALVAVLAVGASIGVFAGHDHHDHGHDHAHEHSHEADHSTAAVSAPSTSGWNVVSGTLGIDVLQGGSIVNGSFASWQADIQFEDPATPGPAGSVTVTIDIPSLTLGSVTTQALGLDYFHAEAFPQAVFTADIEKLADGYEARGTLTIRDKTQPFVLPFALEIEGDTATMVGASSLQRLDYDVGRAQQDESTVGFTVDINVDLTAQRNPAS